MENSGVVHMLKNNKTDGRCTVSFCKTDLLFPSAQNKLTMMAYEIVYIQNFS